MKLTSTAFCRLVALILSACAGQIDQDAPGQHAAAPPGGGPPTIPTEGPAMTSITGTLTAPPPPTSTMPASPEPPPPSPPAPGARIPVPPAMAGQAGILDCPTVDYPGGAATTLEVSDPYRRACAACHGATGEGQGVYPPLPGKLTRAEFQAKVRVGVGNMPAFGREFIDDAALAADFAALSARGDKRGAARVHPSFAWSASEVQAKRKAGLAVWRKPDSHGAACANCHTPDAIDLAVIGYPDHAIQRRAIGHVSAEEAVVLVDYIHAQRRAFNIVRPCATDWRVLQPGGEVLPGKTPQEQDVAFFGELQRREMLVATGKIATDDEALRAWNQLADLNMRTLRWGIPLPRWSEDSFNGSEHRTINDWISVFPRMPKDGKWYELTDAYLADPSDERFLALTRSVSTLTTDNGAAAKGDTAQADISFSNFFRGKSDAALLASHMFRMAATGKKGWADLATPPYPQQMSYGVAHGLPHNPMRTVGNAFQEDHCFDKPNGACAMAQTRALPTMAAVEIDPQAGFPGQVQFMTHPWWSIGFLFDPTLSYRNDRLPGPSGFISFGETQYWTDKFGALNFPQNQVHEPFVFAVNFIKRVTLLDRNKKPGDKTAAVLHGGIFPSSTYIRLGLNFTKLPENNRLLINLMRTVFFKMRREIDAGAAAATKVASYGDNDLEGGLRLWKTSLDGLAKGTRPEAADAANTAALAADLLVRLTTVPRLTPTY